MTAEYRQPRCVSVCHASKCRKRGAADLRRLLDEEIEAAGLTGQVETQRGGCNDLCNRGPSMVVQPDRVWYAGLTPEAVRCVVRQHLSRGGPVKKWVAREKGVSAKKAAKAARKAEKKALKAARAAEEKPSKKAGKKASKKH